jgi:hypothetical protein
LITAPEIIEYDALVRAILFPYAAMYVPVNRNTFPDDPVVTSETVITFDAPLAVNL